QASPVVMVLANASAFMCATMSTSADQASVTTQVIRPSASNLGANRRPSSTCSAVARGAKRDDVSALATTRLAAGAELASLTAHQRDEPDLLAGIVAEQTGELGRDGLRPWFLHTAQRHARVLGLEHHRHPARLQNLVDRGDDLRIEMLLRLQAAGIDVDQ